MRFSLIVPVYNVEKYLAQCLDSILIQTYQDFEIILVNDGSTDSSGEICDSYALKYPKKCKVIHKANLGVLSARIMGLNHCTGSYICFIDSDDFVVPYFLEVLHEVANQSSPDLILFGFNNVTNDKKIISKYIIPVEQGMYANQSLHKFKEIAITSYNLGSIWAKCIKSSIINREKNYSLYYHVNYGEDLLQSLAFFDRAHTIYVLHKHLYMYRNNPTGVSRVKLTVKVINSLMTLHFEVSKYAQKWGFEEIDYKDRLSLIFKRVFRSLINYRYGKGAYTPEERKLLIERILAEDFQTEITLYRCKKKFSFDCFYRYLILTKNVSYINFWIALLGALKLPLHVVWVGIKNIRLVFTPSAHNVGS